MNELIRAALVIARRDYTATVFSKTFLLFLIGPLFPIIFGFVFGSIGANVDKTARPVVAVIATDGERTALTAARNRLADRLGDGSLPLFRFVAPQRDAAAQVRHLLQNEDDATVAVLSGGLDEPVLAGPRGAINDLGGDVSLILDDARQHRLLGKAAPAPVELATRPVDRSAGDAAQGRILTARVGQLVLLMLTMILAGMLLSNLIEEKSNKVIEVLAAAVPIDAIFLGKLIAMLGMSLTGIAVWGGVAALGALAILPPGASLPLPAIGWPMFVLLGVVYFTASYLLLGALFLGIGAQASTVREVQTLSMPVTMGQLVVFAFASSAVGNPNSPMALAATVFPWSSPLVMLARAAQSAMLWPHLLAILWQALWVAVIIRVASRRFRVSVLKSRGARRSWFRRRESAREERT
ncbi:ABC transporter permease [Flavisphingomonas formosensis]|uniref:ABC transporter permease n=1 Tax=Flavisphingomonas formosensis TaxID=861534 RepID=UPI0012FB5AF1|nr:ABC transporter permease [Sphingomonas formosensis]